MIYPTSMLNCYILDSYNKSKIWVSASFGYKDCGSTTPISLLLKEIFCNFQGTKFPKHLDTSTCWIQIRWPMCLCHGSVVFENFDLLLLFPPFFSFSCCFILKISMLDCWIGKDFKHYFLYIKKWFQTFNVHQNMICGCRKY